MNRYSRGLVKWGAPLEVMLFVLFLFQEDTIDRKMVKGTWIIKYGVNAFLGKSQFRSCGY